MPTRFNKSLEGRYVTLTGGAATRLVAFSDDMDGLRKVPDNVPNQAMLAEHLGKPLSRKPNAEEVLDAISGFAPALDLTLRELQDKLKAKAYPWEVAKSFDGACVLAPFVPGDAVEDLSDIGIRLSLNGELRQDGNSRDMLNPILSMIQHMAGHFALQPGDVILTGTPVGVGALNKGDELVLELVGHSTFTSRVL